MKISPIARITLLSAAVCAALAGAGSVGASTLSSDLTDVIRQNDARQAESLEPTLEQMLEPFRYQDVSSAIHFMTHNAMVTRLEGRGLGKTGRHFSGNQQIDVWYSATQDRSVVCVSEADDDQFTQAVYVMPGKIRRAALVPLP